MVGERRLNWKKKWWYLRTGKRVAAGRDIKYGGQNLEDSKFRFMEVCRYHSDLQRGKKNNQYTSKI